jgi:predicted acylesterase/phospholipase RssA
MSGGGLKGIGFLGALQCLSDSQLLQEVSTYIGTSIGSIIGYLLCIGYTPIEIMVALHTEKTMEKLIQAMDATYLTTHGGILNFCIFQDILERLTIKKIGQLINMNQLYQDFGKRLVCCTYNMSLKKVEYIDYQQHPTMPCITALRMSSNLPFLFFPYEYNGFTYVDGGIYDNFPVTQVEQHARAIALYLENEMFTQPDTRTTVEKPFNIMNYLFEILQIPIYHLQDLNTKAKIDKDNIDIVGIQVSLPIFSWVISRSARFDSFSAGYECVRLFLGTKNDDVTPPHT